MNLVPWRKRDNGTHPLVSFRDEMNRLFDSFWSGDFLPERFGFGGDFPKLDVTETDEEVIVRAEVPGMEAKDIDLSVTDGVLTLKGEKKEEKEEKEKDVTRREVHYGSFSRSVRLPSEVDVEKIDAQYDKGVCKIRLPKVATAKSKKIEIKGK